MATHAVYYEGIRNLQRLMRQQRFHAVLKWVDGKVDYDETGRTVMELNAMIDALQVALEDEQRSESAT